MKSKLGLFNEEPEDKTLVQDLLKLMHRHKWDYTNTFVSLSLQDLDERGLTGNEDFKKWQDKWENRLNRQKESKDLSIKLMRNHNPIVIPRNHRVEEALKAALEDGNLLVFKNLLKVLKDPYNYDEIPREYMQAPKDSSLPYVTYCGT